MLLHSSFNMCTELQTDVKLLQIENIFFRNARSFLASEFIWIANALLCLSYFNNVIVVIIFYIIIIIFFGGFFVCLFILKSNFNRDKKTFWFHQWLFSLTSVDKINNLNLMLTL